MAMCPGARQWLSNVCNCHSTIPNSSDSISTPESMSLNNCRLSMLSWACSHPWDCFQSVPRHEVRRHVGFCPEYWPRHKTGRATRFETNAPSSHLVLHFNGKIIPLSRRNVSQRSRDTRTLLPLRRISRSSFPPSNSSATPQIYSTPVQINRLL
ncbi:hypothetical protein CC78DRAFT_113125 [Lojkania enalia]|uniref:Uncharacterized protein n=1 Tax=Lojkania enalia TaxID=147567 RepID=A0A9P4JZ64_9PLEO|nr:hypothetical protein CC78DRAFT_113125 [Didymosphaeria enalia]